jgi:hypothetical protein
MLEHAAIVCVRRPVDEVIRSDRRWVDASGDQGRSKKITEESLRREYDRFWQFWTDFDHVEMGFRDLFEPRAVSRMIEDLTGRQIATPSMPTAKEQKNRIYANKTMTRLLGRHAPRVDTSIFTLK